MLYKVLLEDKMNLSLGFVFFLLTCMNYYYYFNLEEDRFSLMLKIRNVVSIDIKK